METVRDIVVIIFSVTGTFTFILLLFVGFKLYGRSSRALERFGRVSDDIHEAAEGARSGVRLVKVVLEAVGTAFPGPGSLIMSGRAADAIPRIVGLISRIKRPSSVKD